MNAHARTVARRTLRLAASATLLAALVVTAALTLTGTPATTAAATTRITEPVGASAAAVLPAPAFPELGLPDVPLPRTEPTTSEKSVVYTCDPDADAAFGDPAHPNWITNKNCPELNAAKERAQREYRDQLDHEEAEGVGDWMESACSDPASTVYGTATCGGDVNADGLLDGTDRSVFSG